MYAVSAPVAMSTVVLLASDKFGLMWGRVVLLLGIAACTVARRASIDWQDEAP